MRPVVRKAMEIMDGIQLWWLREPEVDLCAEWAEMENLLFPEPCGTPTADSDLLIWSCPFRRLVAIA